MLNNHIYRLIENEIYSYRKQADDIINPVEMARDFQIESGYADFNGFEKLVDKLGYYRIDVDVDSILTHTICCRTDIDAKWLNFTIAHELAHFFIYKNGILKWPTESIIADAMSASLSEDENEIACDLFAREMLMPELIYRKGVEYYRMKGVREGKNLANFLAFDFNTPFIHTWMRGVELEVFTDVA